MSLDNVIAVAAAAEGQLSLLVFGLASSIPMIVAGAAAIMLVLDRFPVVIWLGAMLLGWIAGEVITSDPVVEPFLHRLLDGRIALTIDGTSTLLGVSPHISLDGRLIESLAAALGAMVVLVAGTIWRRSKLRQVKPEVPAASVNTAEQASRRSGVH
jgi:predicted tellurium resistance membrane protein TerC